MSTSTEQNYTDEFYKACFKGDFESASLMLRMGVNLNMRFEHGQNLLHIACNKNFYGLVQLLIKFGCNEFIKDNHGRTPLHYASIKGSTSIARYLIERNTFRYRINNNYSDILTKEFLDCQDNEGKTALYYACEHNQMEILTILLSTGLVDINIGDLDFKTPLYITYEKKFWEIFEILVQNGARVHSEILREICFKGDLSTANTLFKYLNKSAIMGWKSLTDENKNSFLYLAVKFSNILSLVKKFLEHDIKINSKDAKDFLKDIRSLKKNGNEKEKIFKDRYNHYLECLVLFLKHNCFSFNLRPSLIFNFYYDLSQDENRILYEFDERSCSSFLIMLFLDSIYEIFSNIEESQFKEQFESRVIYLFALAIYSSNLNCHNKAVQRWFKKYSDKNKLIERIYTESISSPWSLQRLCRVTIKKNVQNINTILNDACLKKKMSIPSICVKYIDFDYV